MLACQNGLWGHEPSGDDDLVCVRVADFDRLQLKVSLNEPTFRSFELAALKSRVLQRGDLLLEKSGGGDTQPVGTVVLYDLETPAVCSNFIARIPVAPGHDPRFLTYLHAAAYAAGVNQRCIKQNTGIQNLDSDAYLSEVVPIPPLPEQRAIAAFLDRETARLDALIEKKEHLLVLLEEKRTALVTRAVTKGLDPAVSMKESGVEWLGEVPAHWDVVPLKRLGQVRTGVAKGRDLDGGEVIRVPYLRVANVQGGYLDLEDVAEIEVTREEVGRYALRPLDVLMNEGGDYDKLGRGFVWEGQIEPCVHQNHVFAVRLGERASPYWVTLATQASYLRHYFILRSKQSTNLASVSATNVGQAPIVCPPREEQEAILGWFNAAVARLDQLRKKVEDAIALLREYRTGLISAAVTGQIDVSGGMREVGR